jgi:predicted unusual protein kinase regulating ubiquinone biosynthesis (AarF/ABC1/UbiB family)
MIIMPNIICQIKNYITGDLHPGNVFVTKDGTKFVLFDVGIVNEYSDADHQIIVDVLAAFIRKDGRKAGRLMIDDSNSKLYAAHIQDHAQHEEEYINKIEALTIRATTKGYLMEHLGSYISYICNAASTHHVMMNPAFISAALAVKVEEGIALAMDPSIKIPNIAIPIIIESERRRFLRSTNESNQQRIQQFQQWMEHMMHEWKKYTTTTQVQQQQQQPK